MYTSPCARINNPTVLTMIIIVEIIRTDFLLRAIGEIHDPRVSGKPLGVNGVQLLAQVACERAAEDI